RARGAPGAGLHRRGRPLDPRRSNEHRAPGGGVAMRRILALLCAWPALAAAQDLPLERGDYDVSIGVRAGLAGAFFDPSRQRQTLDDAGFSGGSYDHLSLEARVSYALDRGLYFSIFGPLVRAESLRGEVLVNNLSLGERHETSAGLGDISASLALPRAQTES